MKIVGLCGALWSAGQRAAFRSLALEFEVKFEDRLESDLEGLDAAIFWDSTSGVGEAGERLPCLVYTGLNGSKSLGGEGEELGFANHLLVPFSFRGKVFVDKSAEGATRTAASNGLETLAKINGRAVWIGGKHRERLVFKVGTAPPSLGKGQRASQILNGESILASLPAWEFFRCVSSSKWENPPLRACLVVDDPNLHAITYGKIDYRVLLRNANEWGFHAAMATVPLDGWWVNDRSAKLFRENPHRLSLLVHGNDHVGNELAQPLSEEQCCLLADESLRRTSLFENISGCSVDRVMAPPHGVCREQMMKALAEYGFEAMTTNRWSLWAHNSPDSLPADTGLRPADFLGGGLPVINRFRFKSEISGGEIAIAALLGQPIVPYGHHQDFAADMVHVKECVDRVKALGNVQWMSMREIMETNFQQSSDGTLFRIRMFSQRIKVIPPEGASCIVVEYPSADDVFETGVTIQSTASGDNGQRVAKLGQPVDVVGGRSLEIRLNRPLATPLADPVRWPRSRRPLALMRRLISELRDRVA